MEVRTCKSCGRLFNYFSGQVRCPACADALEQKFQEVKSYLWEHKGAGMQEIADVNEVSVGQIRQWVREERLSFTDDSPVGLECESCGATIKTGRYCEACKAKLGNALQSVTKPRPVKEKKELVKDNKNKMRYLH